MSAKLYVGSVVFPFIAALPPLPYTDHLTSFPLPLTRDPSPLMPLEPLCSCLRLGF